MVTVVELTLKLQEAFDRQSDKDIDPKKARKLQAEEIAKAIGDFVIGRDVIVTGNTGKVK